MKVKIKTLEELVRDCPNNYIHTEILPYAGEEVNRADHYLNEWMYTEIKPEVVILYAYGDDHDWVRYSKILRDNFTRLPEYDKVFKGGEE